MPWLKKIKKYLNFLSGQNFYSWPGLRYNYSSTRINIYSSLQTILNQTLSKKIKVLQVKFKQLQR